MERWWLGGNDLARLGCLAAALTRSGRDRAGPSAGRAGCQDVAGQEQGCGGEGCRPHGDTSHTRLHRPRADDWKHFFFVINKNTDERLVCVREDKKIDATFSLRFKFPVREGFRGRGGIVRGKRRSKRKPRQKGAGGGKFLPSAFCAARPRYRYVPEKTWPLWRGAAVQRQGGAEVWYLPRGVLAGTAATRWHGPVAPTSRGVRGREGGGNPEGVAEIEAYHRNDAFLY